MRLRSARARLGLLLDAHGLMKLGSVLGFLRILSMASGVALSVLMARILGLSNYGFYLYALSIAQILALPVLSGLPTLLTRQLAVYRAHEDWSRVRGMIRWARQFIIVMALVVIMIGGGVLWMTPSQGATGWLYFWTLLLVLAMTQLQLGTAMLNGFERPVAASLPDGTIRPILLLMLIAALAVFGQLRADTAMLSHLLAAAVAACWANWHFRRTYTPALHKAEGGGAPIIEGRAWLVSLFPLGLITISTTLYSRLDIFMLGLISTKSEVALYGIALQISGLVALGNSLILGIAGPRMARLWALGDLEEIVLLIRSVNLIVIVSVSLGLLLVALFGGSVIEYFVGADYARSAHLAILTSIIPLVSSLFGPGPLLLLMSDHQQPYVRNTIYLAIINALLNFALIPDYGATGAIVASIVATIVFQVLMARDAYRLCGIRTDIFTLRR